MHKKFDSTAIEQKWQKAWDEQKLYEGGERDARKEKEYVLVELPYPSGNLHIGHWYAFAVPDIYVRYRRMTGVQAIYPMGFDAFGLPAENAAIKRNINPREWTESNIEYMKGQLASMGNAFSWDKTASTIDPDYYRWTQWMFTQFFENNIAYRGSGTVNWCPGCNTVIANEQVLPDGTCERCDSVIEKREMPQWMLRITDYADRLVDDLDGLEWPEHIKDAQRNWIGRSEGAEIDFKLSVGETVTVFTTRPDTLFGATYMVLAPEHALITNHQEAISNWDEVAAYQKTAAQKAEQDRLDGTKEKTGVRLEGITATNPATGEDIPVYIADYVVASYGTGAIMAVPAHDERDRAFAEKFGIAVKTVVEAVFKEVKDDRSYRPEEKTIERHAITAVVYNPKTKKYLGLKHKGVTWETFVNGGVEDGQTAEEAARAEVLEETGYKNLKLIKQMPSCHALFWHVKKNVNRLAHFDNFLFELEDDEQEAVSEAEAELHEPVWLTEEEMRSFNLPEGGRLLFEQIVDNATYTGAGLLCNSGEFDGMDSEAAKAKIVEKVGGRMSNTYRLRDWSIGRQRFWGVPIPIVYDPEGNAHVVPAEHLPWLLPDDVDYKPTGEAPLAKSQELRDRTAKLFGEGWTPEVETMDTFVDSSWYFMRYIDNTCDTAPASLEAQKRWMPIDIYFGGAEHTTMHLLYSRFWQKALFDLGLAAHEEPYKRRLNRGLILGPDGAKMSKSKGNVIDPDEQVSLVGSDTVKMYLAFMGPYGEVTNYPWDMGGIAGIHRFLERVNGLAEHIKDSEPEEISKLVHKTIKKVGSDIQVFKFNTAISAMMVLVNTIEKSGCTTDSYQRFLRMLAPFAPHLSEELWVKSGQTASIHLADFPAYDETLVQDTEVTIGVQVNGKVRGDITIAPEAEEATAVEAAQAVDSVAKYLAEGEITKVIYRPGKILNLIVQ